MKRLKKNSLFFIFCIVFTALNAQENVAVKRTWLLDTIAPAFSVTDVKGKTWDLQKLRGKTVVLNFWALSCGPCMYELPLLNALADSMAKDTSVVFLSLLIDSGQATTKFLKTRVVSYHTVINAGLLHQRYRISCFPTHMVIDPRGIIRYNACGVMTRQQFNKMLGK